MSHDGLEDLSPSEERLLTLLMLLREEAPVPAEPVTEAIMRHARRQLVLRRVGDTLAALFGGIFDGVVVLLGLGPRTAPRASP